MNKVFRITTGACILAIGSLFTVVAQASPVINESETFSASGGTAADGGEAWHTSNAGTTLDISGGTLNLQFPSTDGAPVEHTIVSTIGATFTGNYLQYDPYLTVNFKIYSDAQVPNKLALYLKGVGGREWTTLLSTPTANGWTSYLVPIYSVVWSQYSGAPGVFLSDIASVTSFGFYIEQGSIDSSENYKLDDMVLTVPEPETVWLILAALASLGVTFRGKLASLFGRSTEQG